MKRDSEFCYRIVVEAARVIGNPFASNKELLRVMREYHKKAGKRMPRMAEVKIALREFRKAKCPIAVLRAW